MIKNMVVEIVGVYMVTAPTRVINDGRVTIPAEVRRELCIEEGDYVMIDVRPLAGESDV